LIHVTLHAALKQTLGDGYLGRNLVNAVERRTQARIATGETFRTMDVAIQDMIYGFEHFTICVEAFSFSG